MVAIIIINWNGYNDTIECINSLMKNDYKDFAIFVGDNGSTDNSINHIKSHCETNGFNFHYYNTDDTLDTLKEKSKVILVDLKENYGFAKGNNILIKFASQISPDYFMLLNNDTEVEADFLKRLIICKTKNPEYKVLSPLICYYFDKNKIWSAGGNIYGGIRKWNYTNYQRQKIKENDKIKCTLLSGCALFFDPILLNDKYQLLTERFFFGEEDFEFGLRMKQQKTPMACVLSSVIYHKVGAARNKQSSIGHTYNYVLNRLIDIRIHLNCISFYIFKLVYLASVTRALHGVHHMSVKMIFQTLCKINKLSNQLEGVSRETFNIIMSNQSLDEI